jgi:SAM-dependent methyltransferase
MYAGLVSREGVVSGYTIERGRAVRERMDLLASTHAPATLILLDLIGVPAGGQCVDLGCGGGHIAIELARRVGPTGSVLGIDLDDELLELARTEAAARGLANVAFRVGPVEQFSETDLDLAFARMLFSHLSDPAPTLAAMVAAVKPGGHVIVEDVHFAGCFTEPSCPAYDRWVGWFRETVRLTGADLDIGPRLPGLLQGAGLADVGVRVAQPAFIDGPIKQLQQMSMQMIRTAVLGARVTSAEDFDATHAELKAFTDDPGTLVAGPRMIQAWGRRGW